MFAELLLAVTITLRQGETKVLDAKELGTKGPVEAAIFDGALLPVFEVADDTYLALAVDIAKPPGDYPLQVSFGKSASNFLVRVKGKNFRTIRENVAYKPLTLPPEVRAKKEAERQPMLLALRRGEPGRIWESPFVEPLLFGGKVSSEFGLRRIYTNHLSEHRGVDIVPDLSETVHAISEGRVLYAEDKELYLEGKTVVLDHGQGIISVYLHLAKVRVKTGERVASGQIIGLVGSTGNSTGKHLHLAITVGGAHVDPLQFIGAFRHILGRFLGFE